MMTRRQGFLVCVAALLLGAGCSRVMVSNPAEALDNPTGMMRYLEGRRLPAVKSIEKWEDKYGPGLLIKTRHYEIYTTLMEPLMLCQVPGFVESAYEGYQRQLPRPIKTASRFTLYLFADREGWEDFTRDFTGSQAPMYLKIQKGAYYLNGSCVAYNIGRGRTFSVLGHEGWHQFNSRHFRYRLPSWVDEGIATQFEKNRYEKGLFYFEPDRNGGRLGDLQTTINENRMMPVRELIGLNPGEVVATADTKAVMRFYAQSYALVRFLREDGYGRRLGNFHRLLLGGLRGTWPLDKRERDIAADRNIQLTAGWNRRVSAKLFEAYISDNFDTIEKEYATFCRKIIYHVRARN